MNRLAFLRKWFDLSRLPVRLAIIAFVAVIIPIIFLFVAANNRARELDEFFAEGYVSRVANDYKVDVEEHVTMARSTIKNLVSRQFYFDEFMVLLDTGEPNRQQEVTALLRNWLVADGTYSKVTLFNPTGELVASTSSSDFENNFSGEASFAYRAALDALIIGEQQVFVAGNGADGPVVEVGQIIYRDNGSPAGYLIGTININEVFVEKLPVIDDFIPFASYLVQENGVFLIPAGAEEKITREFEDDFIADAIEGQTGLVHQTVDGREVILYYTRIENSSFVMFTQTTGSIHLAPTVGVFTTNSVFVVFGVAVFASLIAWMLTVTVSRPLARFNEVMNAMSTGNTVMRVPFTTIDDPIGQLARDFTDLRQQVTDQIEDLERRIAARVHDIEATQEISKSVVAQRNLQALMDDVVALIIKSFPNIYHAQIFLVNEDRTYAVLRASTNEPGRKLLERGHRLGVGSISVIGQVTQEGRTVVAVDTATSDVHRRNEFLPDTRAELAIPLRIGEHIIGALDVQSKQPNSFTPDQVTVLQIMADQIAISIDNARLYQDYQRQLEELAQSNKQATLDAWREHLFDRRAPQIVRETGMPTVTEFESIRRKALEDCQVIVGELTDHNTIPVVVPVELRGQVLGTVEWELPAGDFSYDKVQLAEELVNRLAVSLDNARLFQQSQRTVERERVVNTIAARLTGQTDIDEILKTAVREVGQALRVPEVKIRLQVAENGASQNGHQDSEEN